MATRAVLWFPACQHNAKTAMAAPTTNRIDISIKRHHVPRHGVDYSRLTVVVLLGKCNLENRARKHAEWSPSRGARQVERAARDPRDDERARRIAGGNPARPRNA